MAEHCPHCSRGLLQLVDLNPEAAFTNYSAKSGFYEYRCDNTEQCSAVLLPGLTHQRCWCCCEWVVGHRRNGAIICEKCIEAGYEYESFDLRNAYYKNG